MSYLLELDDFCTWPATTCLRATRSKGTEVASVWRVAWPIGCVTRNAYDPTGLGLAGITYLIGLDDPGPLPSDGFL
jgi:hypothetical protein